MDFNTIIYDEAHRLCSTTTKRYKAIKEISKNCDNKYFLTATPVSNAPHELFGIINLISPGYLGDKFSFLNRYTLRDFWGKIICSVNTEELSRKIRPLMIRKTIEEVAPELPKVMFENIYFDMSPVEAKLYDQIRKELLFDINKIDISKIEHPTTLQCTLVKMLVLLELTCSMELLGEGTESTKLDILKEKLADIFVDPDVKVIVFSRFKKMMPLFERELSEYDPLVISGDVNNIERDSVRNSFQNDPVRRLLVSTDAGGEGLTLNRGDIIIHYDLPYSYGKYDQRNGRIKSFQKTRPLMVYNLVAKKSMDAYLIKMLDRKQKDSVESLGDSGLNMADLKSILTYEVCV